MIFDIEVIFKEETLEQYIITVNADSAKEAEKMVYASDWDNIEHDEHISIVKSELEEVVSVIPRID